jgi:hypothetical protein
MNTLVSIVLSKDGLAHRRGWPTSSLELRHSQAEHIPITMGHTSETVGRVIHLELHPTTQDAWIVGHIDEDVREEIHVRVGTEVRSVAHPLYLSAETDCRAVDSTDIVLRSVGIVSLTARVAAQPATILPGPCDHAGAERRWNLERGYLRSLLGRAAAGYQERRARAPIIVRDPGAPDLSRLDPRTSTEAWDAMDDSHEAIRRKLGRIGPLEYRPGYITAVR